MRYGSVAEFATDIQSFLDGRPVAARAPTMMYRTRKFVKRHRPGVIAGAVKRTACEHSRTLSDITAANIFLKFEPEIKGESMQTGYDGQIEILSYSWGVTQAGGYESRTISARTGQATLTGGTATVSSPWAFPGSLIYLTNIGPSAAMGTPFVRSRGTGSFTIGSTSSSDASTIAWMIM